MPADLEVEWHYAAREAIPLLAGLLVRPHPEVELRYLLASLAAFHGCQWFAKKLETLDVDTDREEWWAPEARLSSLTIRQAGFVSDIVT